MVNFASRSTIYVLLLISLALSANAADSASCDRIAQGIKKVTTVSDTLRVATLKINYINAPLTGYSIAQGFAGIITEITSGAVAMAAEKGGPLSDADAKLVVQTLTTFVQVHQALLNVVIGKHGLITLVPFFEPIRVTLVSLEMVVDTFAYNLIALIPTQKSAASDQFASLTVTVTSAQNTYSRQLVSATTVTERITNGIKEVTTLSDNLCVATLKINLINAPLQGYAIAQGFAGIISNIASGTAAMAAEKGGPLSDTDAKLVVQTLTTFVQVHQALLNVVIGKHGLITLIPFFEPIRIALVSLEQVVDTFAFQLIGLIPTQETAASNQFASLSVTVTLAQETYSEQLLANSAASTVTERITNGIKEVTTLSDNLRVTTQRINIYNAPLQGYTIAQGFAGIIGNIASGTAAMAGEKEGPLSDADAKLVGQSLTTFVQVHQALLNTVIGKHGLLTLIPFFEPIRQTLVSLEAAVDTFAFNLIALIPTQKPAAENQFGSLSITVKQAQDTYSQPINAVPSIAQY